MQKDKEIFDLINVIEKKGWLSKKIELIWCIDERNICAPDSKVIMPKKICKNNKILTFRAD